MTKCSDRLNGRCEKPPIESTSALLTNRPGHYPFERVNNLVTRVEKVGWSGLIALPRVKLLKAAWSFRQACTPTQNLHQLVQW